MADELGLMVRVIATHEERLIMSDTLNPPEQRDEILALLDAAINAYLETKRRSPLLLATDKAIGALIRHLNEKKISSREPGIWNDAVWQLLRDSFDTFVIDLASIREALIESTGLLNRLKKDCSRLRRRAPSEISVSRPTLGGDLRGIDLARWVSEAQQHRREEIAKSINDALARLVPNEYPVTPTGVAALIARFIKDTEPLEKDRNHVRAHRYEYRPFDREKHFQPIEQLGGHLDILEGLLGDLYFVLTGAVFVFKLEFDANTESTAADLADLMVHGSITQAVDAYGVARRTKENPTPWYNFHRKRFFEDSGQDGT